MIENVAVADERDAAADSGALVADVAGVEQVDSGHARIVVVSAVLRQVAVPRLGRAPARRGAVMPTVSAWRPADLVLTGGHVHTVDPALPRAEAVAVARRADRRGRVRRRRRRLDRAADARRRPRRPAAAARLPGRPRPPDRPAGWTCSSATSGSACGRDGSRSRRSAAYVGSPPREGLDRRQRLVHGRLRERHAAPRGPRRDRRRTGRRSSRTATATRRWVNSRALELAGIDATTPDPADGRIERDPDGTPTGTLHEGAADARRAPDPQPTPTTTGDEAFLAGQAYLHSLRDHGLAGRDRHARRRSRSTAGPPTAGWLTARVEAALWWERDRGGEQVDEFLDRLAVAAAGPAPGEQREADARRRPRDVHRPRCSTRTSTRAASPTTNRGHRLHRSGGAEGPRDPARRRRAPAALPRDRRPRRPRAPSTRSRPPARRTA